MTLRGVVVPAERVHAGFVQRLGWQAMDSVLRSGWTPEKAACFYGGMGEAAMRRAVAYAYRNGFLR